MRIFLPLLCFLCASPVNCIFDGRCPRKDPPPGTLVVTLGSELVLTCSGQVMVDGVKVRNGSNSNRRGSSSGATQTTQYSTNNTGVSVKSGKHTTESAVSQGYHSNPAVRGENRSSGHTEASTIQPTSVHRLQKAAETDGESDYKEEEEEEEGEGSRVTRGIKSKPLWKLTGRTVGKGDQGEITQWRGATLTLSSVRLTDSGTYACHYKDKERFSLKLIVADPPETPRLFCYKKSPSSKIRCEWTPQKPVTIRPNCSLFLNKSPKDASFQRFQCSYSSRASRCWCALEHDENELRTVHIAFLCVTSVAGNTTSTPYHFTPMHILQPDPPSNVSVQEEEGQETRMKVTWSLPSSWKSQGDYYKLIYELKYRPLMSSFHYEQRGTIKYVRSYGISDAMPGVEYLIQLRTKDEYEGEWSDWSTPVRASSWTAPLSTTTMISEYIDIDSSGTDDNVTDVPPTLTAFSKKSMEVSPHILWFSGSFAVLLVILAACFFRHKGRFMSKLQSLSVFTKCGGSSQPPPSVPAAPEGQALVTLGPPHYREPQPSEVQEGEEEKEEDSMNERGEAFNNTSYFFLQQ